MNKINYITSSGDEKMTGVVNPDYIAKQIANRSIGMIAIAEDHTGFSFSLSGGARIKFRIKANSAELVYYAPSPRSGRV